MSSESSSGDIFLSSSRTCDELSPLLSDLIFFIHDIQITINPNGYLYSQQKGDPCNIAIQPIPEYYERQDIIRLGTIFMSNFYIGLDYSGKNIGFA